MGAHLCPAGCVILGYQHSRRQYGCACVLSHRFLMGPMVMEGPILNHREGWDWRTMGEVGLGLAVKLLTA